MSEGSSPEPRPQGPLKGIRVLDFTSFIAGSYGAMLLGDMGADIPKIGNLRMAGVPWRFSRTPASIRRPAPRLGEHTDEVLAELGYDTERIASLEASGAAGRVDETNGG